MSTTYDVIRGIDGKIKPIMRSPTARELRIKHADGMLESIIWA